MQASPDFEKARQAYRAAQDQGVPKHKLATTVSKQTSVIPETIRKWAKKYQWHSD